MYTEDAAFYQYKCINADQLYTLKLENVLLTAVLCPLLTQHCDLKTDLTTHRPNSVLLHIHITFPGMCGPQNPKSFHIVHAGTLASLTCLKGQHRNREGRRCEAQGGFCSWTRSTHLMMKVFGWVQMLKQSKQFCFRGPCLHCDSAAWFSVTQIQPFLNHFLCPLRPNLL